MATMRAHQPTTGYAARAARLGSGASSRQPSALATRTMLGSTMAATASANDLKATISVKDIQQCFDKERRAFIRDLESLRQQLVKKDQLAAKAASVASQQAIQLKKEIASLQAALAASEGDSAKYQEQYRHTSSLLETALDQHHADQAKINELSETVRTLERKHEDTVAMVRKEAAASVNNTLEERKALRTRVDQLRCKLETERKEWATMKKPMGDDLDKTKMRLSIVEKELHESRFREQSSFQLKEKMSSEVVLYKRKVADLSTALQEALQAKSEMKGEHQLTVRKMKDKWREMLHSLQQAKEQLIMVQEDYNGLFRTRQLVVQQHDHVVHSMRAMKARHEMQLKEKEDEYWDLEKRFKRTSATCTVCMKTPEQRNQELEVKMDAVREQTRLAVSKEMELERWDRYQDVNGKYMDVCRQLQVAMRDGDHVTKELKALGEKYDELQAKEKKLVDMLSRAEKRVNELERKAADDAHRAEEHKHQIQELMENLSKMTTLSTDQSKQLQDLELGRREEVERLKDMIKKTESEQNELLHEKTELEQQLEQQAHEFEQIKDEKAKQWNEIVAAQLSANLLIEEQAHTIDNLLKSRYNSPSKTKSSTSPRRGDRQTSGVSMSSTEMTPSPDSDVVRSESATVLVLRRECDRLRDELSQHSAMFNHEKEELQSEYEKKVVALMQEITGLQKERTKMKRRLEEQAVTIHELTLQDEEDDDDDEDVDEDEDYAPHEGESDELDISDEDDGLHNHHRGVRITPAAHTNHRRSSSNNQSTEFRRQSQEPVNSWPHSRSASMVGSTASRIRGGRSSVNFKNMSHDLSAIHRHSSDGDTTIGTSFVST